MESMASIAVCTRFSKGSIVQPGNENVDRSTSEALTEQLQN
jgi:hypothetical protein